MAQRTKSMKSKTSTRPKGKTVSHKAKSSLAKPAKSTPHNAGDEEVTIDRRRGSRREVEVAEQAAPAPKLERRKKVNRRRQIDPTTCERDYTDDEIQFMNALEQYKRTSGRMFPTCSEVLEVIRGLGYVQLTPGELAARTPVAAPMPPNYDESTVSITSIDAWQ